jgi:cardiolipin synthase
MFRVEGDGVVGLQSAFVENWVESSGQIITGSDYFPAPIQVQGHPALMVASSPSMGGSTTARILFTALISAAHRSIDICTPYFIPDKGLRDELARAAHDRGVRVRILVPGDHTDHKVVRASSRSNYGELLEAGAEVYEYRPAMIHEKLLIVDDAWVVVGSTNMDTRSFGINDEVNLAVLDPALATRITEQYERDLGESQSVSLEKWKHRSVWERGIAWLGFLWSRQQ